MDTISRVLSTSPTRQQLRSLVNRVHPPAPLLPLALQPHPSLLYAFGLLQRLVGYVDTQLIDSTHHFFLECSPQFRDMRTTRQLGRLLAASALLKRSLNLAMARQPEERHIRIAYSRLNIQFPFGSTPVLGVLVILNTCCLSEAFGKHHFASAVQTIINDSKPLTLGFVHQISQTEGYMMAYLEFKKEGNVPFKNEDINLLRAQLADEIKEHIQPLEPHIYCQRNEEEVYRNAIILCHELRTIHDIPQVMINYEQLEDDELIFTVLLARASLPTTLPLQQLWRANYPSLPFVNERTTFLDHFSKGGRKEISIFKLYIPKKNFRCKNYSIDVYAARRFIEQALKEILGDIRDYNGGLILKQQENRQKFLALADNLSSRSLMENFFLSIQPLAMQCTLLPELLQNWYNLLKTTLSTPIPERNAYTLTTHSEEGWLLICISLCETSGRPVLDEALSELPLASYEKATSWLHEGGSFIFSCAYLTYDIMARKEFIAKIEKALKNWEKIILTRQHLRINLRHLSHSLDPRLSPNDSSTSLFRMLFEGLLRKRPDGGLQLAIAESVNVSPDGKTYTFTLRETRWSNGELLTARDVEYSWKKAIDPRMHSLFAHTFYVIKNARDAHQGKISADAIGVFAVDSRTLSVELEAPAPHFLEATAHWTYSIIPAEIDRANPDWAYEEGQRYICNGPFLLHTRHHGQAIILFKNPSYWDADNVKLEKITIHTVQDPLIEKEMFLKGEIDLLTEPITNLSDNEGIGREPCELLPYPISSVFFLGCNTSRIPFNNQKIRQALQEILWHHRTLLAQESGISWSGPASSILPEEVSLHTPGMSPTSLQEALELFEDGLNELQCKIEDFPKIDLIFNTPSLEKLSHSIARVLRQILKLNIDILKNTPIPYYKRLVEGHYHLTVGIWDSWLYDPSYTLDCFKYREDPNNTSNWEDPAFISALEKAAMCNESTMRNEHLRQAEHLLTEAIPVIPLFKKRGAHFKKIYVHDVVLGRNNEIDLKWTYIQ